MKYSPGGLWGRAVYFSTRAAYSHNYRCTKTQVTSRQQNRVRHQLFLAKVLIGESYFSGSNKELTMPPLKEGTKIRYDSVNG